MTPAVTPQPDQQAPPQTLAQRIRAKYPGEYDDMDDQTLETKVLAKYPEYSDLPRTQPTATIGAAPSGVLPWLRNVESDIRTGTASTGPGKVLRFLGAPGIESGTTPATANQIAGPLIGPVTAAQGVAEKSPLKFLTGALQTASPALAFSAPEAVEGAPAAADAAGAAMYKNVPFLGKLFASGTRAGENFKQAAAAAKDNPVPITDELSGALSRYQQLVDAGGSRALSVNKLLNRVTSPDKGPLTYGEARDFYSNISRLSADEMQRLTPVMKQQIGAIRAALNNAVQGTANQAGVGPQYSQAMSEFAQAARNKDLATKAAKIGAGAAVGHEAYGLYRKLTGR